VTKFFEIFPNPIRFMSLTSYCLKVYVN